ncbi:MAG TPA: hypothetical protein VK791_01185 [bacterium]|jgi:hypothetical protein|nr:hypothetical protein [bacterium]
MLKKNLKFLALSMLMTTGAWADGQFILGATYNGWNTNYQAPAQDNGYEFLVPVDVSYRFMPELKLYGQGEFMAANDVGSAGTYTLSNFSDTILGAELNFKTFGLSSLCNVAFNVPTGDTSWSTKEQNSIVPTQFIDSRYSGRGFGMSAFYGLALPEGRGAYNVGVGYLYSGAFNPSYGNITAITALKLGDAVFFAANHITPYQDDQNEIVRFSIYQSFATLENNQNYYQLGTNFNASYNWSNPKALSFEVGTQLYMPSSWSTNGGPLVTEVKNSNGPRVYATSSYAFGDLSVAGVVKYIFQSDSTINYNGGGFLAGLGPAYRLKLAEDSDIKFSGMVNYVNANNNATDANGNLTSTQYIMWTLSTAYEVKL